MAKKPYKYTLVNSSGCDDVLGVRRELFIVTEEKPLCEVRNELERIFGKDRVGTVCESGSWVPTPVRRYS
jgi:hypothetical protein